MAIIFSGIIVGIALLIGLILNIPFLNRWWNSRYVWAGLLIGFSLFILIFGYSLGITFIGTNPETGEKIKMLHPLAGIIGYFTLLFSISNWPIKSKLTK